MMTRFCLSVFFGVLCVSSDVIAAQIANVKYIHDYINQKHSVNINIANPLQTQAANMKYLLCTVDVVNQELNSELPAVRYCDNALASQQVVDTNAVIGTIDSLVSLSDGDPYLQLAIDDYSEIYTYSSEFNALHPNYTITSVTISTDLEERLRQANVYPYYYIQAMCSTKNQMDDPETRIGTPTYSWGGGYCWCRAKRKIDATNGYWILAPIIGTLSNCGKDCPGACADFAMTDDVAPYIFSFFN